MRAAVYVRTYEAHDLFTGYEAMRDRLLLHCQKKGYQPIVVLGITGQEAFLEDAGRKKLYQLSELGLVDVIVMPDLHTISDSIEKTEYFFWRILKSEVKVEFLEIKQEESRLYREYVNLQQDGKNTLRSRGWRFLIMKKWKGGCKAHAD